MFDILKHTWLFFYIQSLKIQRFSEPQKRFSNSPDQEANKEEYFANPIYSLPNGTTIPKHLINYLLFIYLDLKFFNFDWSEPFDFFAYANN